MQIEKRKINLPSPQKGKKEKISAKGKFTIQYGRQTIDLSYVEQLAEKNQTEFIALVLRFLYLNREKNSMTEKVKKILENIEKDGFTKLKNGNLAAARIFEIMAAINRLRGIKAE